MPYVPDYKRFHVFQEAPASFTLMDESTGWCWKGISSKSIVHKMMEYLTPLEFKDEQYKRVRRLDGAVWEREFADGTTNGEAEYTQG